MTSIRLSRAGFTDLPSYPERMIQFGDGNFMRAFVDWQLQQMNHQGLFGGSAVIIQPIAPRLNGMYAEQDHLYTVLLKGISNGETVNTCEIISCVSRVLNPSEDYEAYLALAGDDRLEFITSNTTEAGIAYHPGDKAADAPPVSFPGKLTALLHRRYQLGKKGFVIIPCELIDRNGEKLLGIVKRYGEEWNLGDGFQRWLEEENTFCCSLVDRIVPGYPRTQAAELEEQLGYRDTLMVTSEPYLLWVIEGPEWLQSRLPLAQAGLNVIITADMTPYRERKVHLLNGPHTAMVPLGLLSGLETVEDVMTDEAFSAFVRRLIERELIPMLNLPSGELKSFAEDVLERFRNPFIRHELGSIALNSISKFKARLLPVLLGYVSKRGELPPLLTLSFAALLYSYRGDVIARQDGAGVTALFDKAWADPETFVESILREDALWGTDLTAVPGLAARLNAHLDELETDGARSALLQLL